MAIIKDDGFEKRKHTGRVDVYRKWETIKEKWVRYYNDENRREEPGFSVNKVVTADMEWCAESYLETDYSNLSDKDFILELKKYASFKVLNQ